MRFEIGSTERLRGWKSIARKVAIVFNYEAFRFEAWLAARNLKVQRQ